MCRLFLICLFYTALVGSAVHADVPAAAETPEQLQARIARLIAQLGDEQYIVRQAAQSELQKIGPPAFDAISAAEEHDDIEVAARARYLVQLIRIDWTQAGDSPVVRQHLENYDSLSENDRLGRMRQLSTMAGDAGLEALCRLVRFERSPQLSKEAAIMVMEQPEPSAKQWPTRKKIIETTLTDSSRPAARWLRAYAIFAEDPRDALAKWDKLVAEELAIRDNAAPEVRNAMVLKLHRRQVAMLLKLKERDGALDVMRRMIALETGDPKSVSQLVDWLVQQQAWGLVDEAAAKFTTAFAENAVLKYSLAQARQAQGKSTEATKLAAEALSLQADQPLAHISVAHTLQERGLFDWAEREYRFVLGTGEQENEVTVLARVLLSEMLHDLEREKDAADVLKKLCDAMDRSEDVTRMVQQRNRDPGSVRSRMHYFAACDAEKSGDKAAQLKRLEEGIKHDPTDADVLIALYRTSAGDAARRKRVLEQIDDAAEQFAAMINDDETDPTPRNQYAWLIGNTTGNFDLAVQHSHKSIELALEERPDPEGREPAGYLDTLAHCYAAKGDYESAVKFQSRAVELEPHTLQIQRALAKFKAALEAREKKSD